MNTQIEALLYRIDNARERVNDSESDYQALRYLAVLVGGLCDAVVLLLNNSKQQGENSEQPN